MERYHATSVLSLTARHPARAGRAPGKGCNGERRLRFQERYLRPRRLASPPTCGKMLTRAVFSEGDAARPITASQPPGAHARLASITGQGGKAALTPPQICAAKPRGLQAPPATAAGAQGICRLHLVSAASRPFPAASVSRSAGNVAR